MAVYDAFTDAWQQDMIGGYGLWRFYFMYEEDRKKEEHAVKILFYDTKKYDRDSFEKILPEYSDLEVEFLEADLSPRTAALAKGYDAICAFVSSDVSEKVVECLAVNGVKLV